MVLGQDFDTEAAYCKSLNRGYEELTATWKWLVELLNEVPIAKEGCFFTNFFMGLRAGTKPTGLNPGAGDKKYVEACRQLLLDQIDAQKPRLIVVLGAHVPRFMASLSPQLGRWEKCRCFGDLDLAGPLVEEAEFPANGQRATVAVILHPCLRKPNLRHRLYRGLRGQEAEMRLLRDAMEAAGL